MPRSLRRSLLATLVAAAACARAGPPAGPVPLGWVQEGRASWYGPGFHGRPTASGEAYDMDAMTAAHRSLPFGARLRVENLDNGRVVEVRVNDRGPFARGRILDLSREAARRLEMIGPGTARIRLRVVGLPADAGCWTVQAGAFRDRGRAEALRRRIEARGLAARAEPGGDGWVRVLMGPFERRDRATRTARAVGGFVMRCVGGAP